MLFVNVPMSRAGLIGANYHTLRKRCLQFMEVFMDVTSLTKYAFIVQTNCPMWPNHCVMVEHPLGEYVKLADIKEPPIKTMPELPSVKDAFWAGHAAGGVRCPVDLAYKEWQFR